MTGFCRRVFRRGAWAIAVLVLGAEAHARPRFDSWAIENGLPQNSVNDILQTPDGYLWLATFGGLVRFDGVRFVVFDRSVAGVGSLRVRALHVDREGTLWAATEDGMLIRHRDGRFRTFTRDDGLPQAVALRIEEDAQGRLWITWLNVVTRYDGVRFVNFGPGDFPRGVRGRTGPRFPPGPASVWWSLDGDGLHCLRAGEVSTCLPRNRLPAAAIAGVTIDWRGALWIHTAGAGVIRIDAEGRRRDLTRRDGVTDDHVDGVFYEDGSGAVWHGDPGGRLCRLADGRREPIDGVGALSFHEDREGSLWIGSTGGLHRLRVTTITNLTTREGLSSDNVYAMLRDRRGDVWIGTMGAGLNRSANGRVTHYRTGHGLPSDYVTSLFEDRSGRLWVGTRNGLAHLEDGRFRPFVADGVPPSIAVMAMHEDRAGNLWFGADRGLVRRQGDRVTTFTEAAGLARGAVLTLLEDRSGALWIGTTRGLSRFQDGTLTTYDERHGLVGNYVRALHEDADGVMWIGTYDGGLYRMEKGRLTRYTTRDGLHDNGVFQILEDDDGNFWMGSNRGISRVSRRELNQRAAGRLDAVRSTAFGGRDGLAMVECNGGNQPAGIKMPDGTLWFPTQGGVAIVDTRAVRTNVRTPPVLIEAFHLQGEAMPFGAGVTANPDRNSFEVRYTALSFVKPEQVRFRYRLAGLDAAWIDAGDRRTAAYYRVPPGRYEFEVMAANSDGVWSSDSARVAIVVLAPVWQRTWFLALMGLVLVGVIAGLERRRTRRQHRERARQQAYARQLLETQEGERRRISTDLHDSLGQSLLLIRAQARMAGDEHNGNGQGAGLISSLAGKAYDDMKEIAYDLRPYQLDKIGVSRTIDGMLRRTSTASGIDFDADIGDIDAVVPAPAAIHVFRIVQEGVNNIVRHSRATQARVRVWQDAARVQIEIEDNGCGLGSANGSPPDGPAWGFGLMGIEERARSLNGEVTIRSTPGCGTTIHVTLRPGGPLHA
jgi:signal transduction histidine kinase/ligand-binding sensor domain-containing protein